MIAIKHQPATSLPWSSKADSYSTRVFSYTGAGVCGVVPMAEADAAYIAHAANAYQKLVEALQRVARGEYAATVQKACAASLLRELGEAS